MDKEVLSFTVRNQIATVGIYFEFYNPEKADVKLLVGFQAPSSAGDVPDEMSGSPQIRNFKIQADNKLLPFVIKAADCDTCALKDTSDVDFSQENNGVFVYLFEITFKPGINRINHSYQFPASSDVVTKESYSYILTTGSKWAGGIINDFTLNIDMGTDSYLFVSDIFHDTARWKISGAGRISEKSVEEYDVKNRMVRLLSGTLEIKVSDFKPDNNLHFGVPNRRYASCSFLYENLVPHRLCSALQSLSVKRDPDEEVLSQEDLRILRNMIYARYGYSFKTKNLQDYFTRFTWYIQDPSLKIESISLTPEEQAFVDEILFEEKVLSTEY